MSDVRPRLLIVIVAVWALIQVVRLSALSLAQSILSGANPVAWLFPAYLDVFIGSRLRSSPSPSGDGPGLQSG